MRVPLPRLAHQAMDEPECVSDARVGKGSRRVQLDRARLQSQARPQHRRASVSVRTVRSFEAGQRVPMPNNVAAMRRVIESAGIRLLFDSRGDAAGIVRQDAGDQLL